MGQVKNPMVHSQTDAPEESDLGTAWQLFPLDDDQTCHSKDWVGDWVGVELLDISVKTGSQTVGDQRRRRQDVVGKATHGRRGPRDPRWSFEDQLVIRCSKESHHQAESWAPGARVELSSPGERERHNADGHKSGGSIYCSSVRSPTPSHTQTLQIKWEVYFFKEVFIRHYSLRQYVCVLCVCIVNHGHGYWVAIQHFYFQSSFLIIDVLLTFVCFEFF